MTTKEGVTWTRLHYLIMALIGIGGVIAGVSGGYYVTQSTVAQLVKTAESNVNRITKLELEIGTHEAGQAEFYKAVSLADKNNADAHVALLTGQKELAASQLEFHRETKADFKQLNEKVDALAIRKGASIP